MSKEVARKLARELGYRFDDIDSGSYKDRVLTDRGRMEVLRIAQKAMAETVEVFMKEQHTAAEEVPEQEREEVTGLSTRATSANFSNSGFGGGCTVRLAAAE